MTEKAFAAIIVAAGESSRMNGTDKLWHLVAAHPIVEHATEVFVQCASVCEIVLVVHPDRLSDARRMCAPKKKVVSVVSGGKTRRESVRIGLGEVHRFAPNREWVIVHDGARPCLTADVLARGIAALREGDAAIPIVPVVDTVKTIAGGHVVETLDRSSMGLVQTPQLFSVPLLARAHAAAMKDAVDDAALVERLGERVVVFAGARANMKITTREDLAMAEALLRHSRT